jgi:hypothetical protein
MSRLIVLALAGCLLAPPVAAQEVSFEVPKLHAGPKIPVMVLGSPHLANPGRDYRNATMDDVLAPKRQAELERVAEQLAAFRPTRIAVEAVVADSAVLQAKYAEYLRTDSLPGRSEAYQVGFRLAKRLGHARVYAIDYKQDMRVGEVLAWGPEHGQGATVGQIQGFMGRAMPLMQRMLGEMTIGQIYARASRPDFLSLTHEPYLLMARIGDGTEEPGWQDVSGWYARNMRIFVNLTRIVSAPDDRVLVIFGQGHAPLLRHYVEASGDFTLAEPADYIRE